MRFKSTIQPPIWFLATGCIAAAVHMMVFVWLVHACPLVPVQLHNAMAFGIAFFVGFVGHRHGSFRCPIDDSQKAPLQRSFWRFLVVALAGLLTNELLFTLLLKRTAASHEFALLLGMMVAAVQTHMLGKRWAFSLN